MGAFTDRYALYLAAGGSSGTIAGDDTVDVDKLNDNFRIIDDALGIKVAAKGSITNPRKWQVVKDPTVGGELYLYSSAGAWAELLPTRLKSDTPDGLNNTYLRIDNFAATTDSRYYTQDDLLVQGKIDGRYVTRNSTGLIKQTMLPYKILFGRYTATTTADGVRGYSDKNTTIQFTSADNYLAANAFTAVPKVFLVPDTGATAEQHFGVPTVTKTSFSPYYWRADTVDTAINWFAIGV